MNPLDLLNERIRLENIKPVFTDVLVKYLSTRFTKDEGPLCFRLGLDREGQFTFLWEDIIQTNDEVMLETPDITIICDEAFYDLFRGWTIDLHPYLGGIERITLSYPQNKSLFFLGDKYPVA